jgi:hypothetical protein
MLMSRKPEPDEPSALTLTGWPGVDLAQVDLAQVDLAQVGLAQVGLAQVGLAQALSQPTRCNLPDDLSIEVWCQVGTQLFRLSEASSWWIGDWLVYGQNKFRDRYKRAMAETSLDYQTLRNYAWAARKFEPARRRTGLTFQHHVEVASLPPDQQDHWLDFAERLGWSRNELRKQVKASGDNGDAVEQAEMVRLNLQIPVDRFERWKQAATQSECSLIDWIARALDEMATGDGDEMATGDGEQS